MKAVQVLGTNVVWQIKINVGKKIISKWSLDSVQFHNYDYVVYHLGYLMALPAQHPPPLI